MLERHKYSLKINTSDIFCIIGFNLIQSFLAFQVPLRGCLHDAFCQCRNNWDGKSPQVSSAGDPYHNGRVSGPSVSLVSITFHIDVNLIIVRPSDFCSRIGCISHSLMVPTFFIIFQPTSTKLGVKLFLEIESFKISLYLLESLREMK